MNDQGHPLRVKLTPVKGFTLKAVAEAAGGNLNQAVKLTIFLTDLANFATVNAVMEDYFDKPYPARAAVGVASLPKGADVEADAIIGL